MEPLRPSPLRGPGSPARRPVRTSSVRPVPTERRRVRPPGDRDRLERTGRDVGGSRGIPVGDRETRLPSQRGIRREAKSLSPLPGRRRPLPLRPRRGQCPLRSPGSAGRGKRGTVERRERPGDFAEGLTQRLARDLDQVKKVEVGMNAEDRSHRRGSTGPSGLSPPSSSEPSSTFRHLVDGSIPSPPSCSTCA